MGYIDPGLVAGVIKAVADACVEGALVLELCELGDQMILEETKKVFKKEKEMKKGEQEKCTYTNTVHITAHLSFTSFIVHYCRFSLLYMCM